MLVRAVEGRINLDGGAENLDGIGLVRRGICRRHEGRGGDGAHVERGGHFADGLVGLRMLGEGDEDAVPAEDAGLLAGDGGDGWAEPLGVVERDVSDDGEKRLDDIGGVETAAQADFENGDVDGASANSRNAMAVRVSKKLGCWDNFSEATRRSAVPWTVK